MQIQKKTPVDSVFAGEVNNLKAIGSATHVSEGSVENTISYTFKTGFSENNYEITATPGSLQINKAGTMTIAGTSYNGTYDKNAHGDAAVPSVTDGTTVSYSTDGGETWTTDIPQITNAGTVTVKTMAENDNYTTAYCEYSLSVTPAKVTVPTAVSGLVYAGKEITGVVLPEKAVYELSGNTATDAGNYTAIAELTDKDNYVWDVAEPTTENQYIDWSITAFTDNQITELSCGNVKAGGVPSPTAKVSFGEIIYTYSADGENWGTWEEVYTEPGEYQVKASVEETTNYNGCESTAVTFQVGGICEGDVIVKFNELFPGQYKMFLNNKDTGIYNYRMVIGGYTIQDAATGKYVCLTNGKIEMQNTCKPTVWAKDVASFHASAVSTGILCICSRYYLNADCKGRLIASRLPGITHFAIHVEADEHTYGCAHDNCNGTHTCMCIVCGHMETNACTYNRCGFCSKCGGLDLSRAGVKDVKVCVTSSCCGSCRNRYTLYTAHIEPVAFAVKVAKVEYSTDGSRYCRGCEYSSKTNITRLWIRVTDSRGIVTKWFYNNGKTVPEA